MNLTFINQIRYFKLFHVPKLRIKVITAPIKTIPENKVIKMLFSEYCKRIKIMHAIRSNIEILVERVFLSISYFKNNFHLTTNLH